jgi:hypothetical protein
LNGKRNTGYGNGANQPDPHQGFPIRPPCVRIFQSARPRTLSFRAFFSCHSDLLFMSFRTAVRNLSAGGVKYKPELCKGLPNRPGITAGLHFWGRANCYRRGLQAKTERLTQGNDRVGIGAIVRLVVTPTALRFLASARNDSFRGRANGEGLA